MLYSNTYFISYIRNTAIENIDNDSESSEISNSSFNNTFRLKDIKCKGNDNCEKSINVFYNGSNHDVKLVSRSSLDNVNKFVIDVYVDNEKVYELDEGGDAWQSEPKNYIFNLDGYIYVIDSKYIGIVYPYFDFKTDYKLAIFNDGKKIQSDDVIVRTGYYVNYMTVFNKAYNKNYNVDNLKSMDSLTSIEFDGSKIKYWDMDYKDYCTRSNNGNDGGVIPKYNQYELTYDGNNISSKVINSIDEDGVLGGAEVPCFQYR